MLRLPENPAGMGAAVAAACYVLIQSGTAMAADAAAPTTMQSIFLVINFVAFIALIVIFGGPAIRRYYAERRAGIADAIEESKQMRIEAERKLQEYSSRLDAFDREREELLVEYREIGERDRERIVAEAKAQAERIKEDARAQAEQESRRARTELESQILDRAVELAADEVERRMNPLLQDRLIDNSIEQFKSLQG